jgi:hypothetical protein
MLSHISDKNYCWGVSIMPDIRALITRRLITILLLVALACAVGVVAGKNDSGVSATSSTVSVPRSP